MDADAQETCIASGLWIFLWFWFWLYRTRVPNVGSNTTSQSFIILNSSNINSKCSYIKLSGHLIYMVFSLFLRSRYFPKLSNIWEVFFLLSLSWCWKGIENLELRGLLLIRVIWRNRVMMIYWVLLSNFIFNMVISKWIDS